MKKEIVINNQKLKFYSINQLRYSARMRNNFREEISDKDTLVNYILEQLKCNKVDEVSWSCFLQELMTCVEIEQVPGNWEELKTMCKEIKEDIIWNEDYCEIKNFKISKDGNIYYRQIQIYNDGIITKNYITVVNDRTISQIWAFIKSLIGEE